MIVFTHGSYSLRGRVDYRAVLDALVKKRVHYVAVVKKRIHYVAGIQNCVVQLKA
jgi:hypothetical protein